MAYCSTSSSQSGNLLPESLLKQRLFECHEASFLESSPLEDDYVYSDFKRLAEKDEKLRVLLQFIPHFEAQKRARSYMKTFLQEKAEKIRRDEDEDTDEDEDEDTEDEDTEDEDTETIPVEVVYGYGNKQAKLMKLELRSFIFKLWLRRIDLTKNEDREKYTSLQNFEQAIHNVQEVIKEYKCSIYKQNYNEEELENRLETISNKVLEEKEQANFEMTDEDSVRFQCQTSRLCALLGLELDFLDDLEETKPECRHHRKLSDWVEIFLEDSIESAVTADYNSLTKELLVSIGFDPLSTAVETMMARSFAGSPQQHIEASEWAQIFIKDEFKYNPLLSPLTPKFPFQRDLTNTWFHLPSTADEESENSAEDLCHVNIMNLVTEKSNICSKTRIVLSGFVPEDDENIILYHGTDHKSANNILIRGIHLYAGRQKRDFSCGKGFYLTKNIEDALIWAKSTTVRPAIVIFVVKREYLDKARKLNLNESEEKWLEIVSCFRTAKRTANMRKSLSSFDLIEGPLASVTRSETPDELVFKPKPFSYQMCLISDSFAEEFEKTLHSVVFYDIS